ncbi:MAG: hypothetical protein M3460_06860 [Actinomycetota bacterium]|nr:hypothetical protein [Actinomycetota bacterium]
MATERDSDRVGRRQRRIFYGARASNVNVTSTHLEPNEVVRARGALAAPVLEQHLFAFLLVQFAAIPFTGLLSIAVRRRCQRHA